MVVYDSAQLCTAGDFGAQTLAQVHFGLCLHNDLHEREHFPQGACKTHRNTMKNTLMTLWLFTIAMENGPFIDDFPI